MVRTPRLLTALVSLVLALTACATASEEPSSDGPPLVGMLRVVPDEDQRAFVAELRTHGWADGRDVSVVPSSGDDVVTTVEEARAALRSWREDGVALVVAFSTPLAELLLEELDGTPGLFLVNDPLAAGLVDDLRAPSLGLTGVTFRTPADRTIDLAARALGSLDHVGYLAPADDPAVPGHRAGVTEAAASLGIRVTEATFATPDDVAAAVQQLAEARVDVVYLASSTATVQALQPLQTALDDAGLPTIANTDFVTFALLVLTPDGEEVRRQLARQAARILSGADVSSVPVETPRKFVLILNRTKARALGLPEMADDLLRQADVVR